MKNRGVNLISRILVFILLAAITCSYPLTVRGENDDQEKEEKPYEDPLIVVSLGDSYASGEGIEKFFGQDKGDSQKVVDANWVAHRSTDAWSAFLQIPLEDGTVSEQLRNYHIDVFHDGDTKNPKENIEWYFVAASGATTKDYFEPQEKTVHGHGAWYTGYLYPQLDVFKEIDGDVDYVTMTIGGNDIGFREIVKTCFLRDAVPGIYCIVFSDSIQSRRFQT